MCVFAHACREHAYSRCWCLPLLLSMLLEKGLSLKWKLTVLGCLTREVPGATFLGPCKAGVTCTWSHAWLFYMGARDLNAGSNACRTTIPTHWAISPALKLFLRNYYYFFFLDEIVVGARVSHKVRLWSSLTTHFMTAPGRYAPGASSKMLCHASQYEALGKGPNVSVSGFLDLWNDYWHSQCKGSYRP